jgi:hypothetical protein
VRRAAVGLLTACALAASAAPAAAERVDGATYRQLLAAAPRDRTALARLRAVTAVDGRAVALGRVLAGSDARVRARLAVLRANAAGDAAPAAGPRRAAAAILRGPDYRERKPGALARALSWLADLLSIPAGANGIAGLVAIGAVVAAVGALAALLLGSARRRSVRAALPADTAGALGVGSASADELDRRAAAAEGAGRLEDAMRLRLAAALTRLDADGVIAVRRDTTVGQVATSLRSHDFDLAADRFAGVVYGRRAPTAADAGELRDRLAASVAEARRR